jgi:hypothetical protein
MKSKGLSYFIIGTFVTLYAIVSVISTIHVIDFFKLSNPEWLAISLAVAFEIGAAASLASLIALKKMNRSLVWGLFIVLTLMQMMGNTYYAFTNLENFQDWVDLFGLSEEEPIFQKRILSLISGGVLPLVALGFIKSLIDYIKPTEVSRPLQNEPDSLLPEKTDIPEDEPMLEATEKISATEPVTLENSQISNNSTWPTPMYSEKDKRKALEELTDKDLELYKEKSRLPLRETDKTNIAANPHLTPGVRT